MSRVRWECQGGGSADDEFMVVFRGAVGFGGVCMVVNLDFVMVERFREERLL